VVFRRLSSQVTNFVYCPRNSGGTPFARHLACRYRTYPFRMPTRRLIFMVTN